MKLTDFKKLIIKEKEVLEYLVEEGDFSLACLRTCVFLNKPRKSLLSSKSGNLWQTILGCLIQDDVLVGVAVLVA